MAGGTTPIKDQGKCGSCVAFATVALAEFMHMRKYGTTNTTTDLSEQVRGTTRQHVLSAGCTCGRRPQLVHTLVSR
jgi:C1A family cysteine protease